MIPARRGGAYGSQSKRARCRYFPWGVLDLAAAIRLGIGIFEGDRRVAFSAALAFVYLLGVAVFSPLRLILGSPTLSVHGSVILWLRRQLSCFLHRVACYAQRQARSTCSQLRVAS